MPIKSSNMRYIYILFTAFYFTSCSAQSAPCTVNVFEKSSILESKIPEKIKCQIPNDRLVYKIQYIEANDMDSAVAIYSFIDSIYEGATRIIDIYIPNSTSAYHLSNSFTNLLPKYYTTYSLESVSKLDSSIFLNYPYDDKNPIRSIDVRFEKISIEISPYNSEFFTLTYEYKNGQFSLESCIFTNEDQSSIDCLEEVTKELGLHISGFNIEWFFSYFPD